MREAHFVPLSRHAVERLVERYALTGHREFMLPNTRRPKSCMSTMTLNRALARMGFNRKATIGFRAPGLRQFEPEVADRGLLSPDNLATLQDIRLSNGQPLEFILAVPGRRYSEFVELLADFHDKTCAGAREEIVGELPWSGLRLVIAHDPIAAATRTQRRRERTDATHAPVVER